MYQTPQRYEEFQPLTEEYQFPGASPFIRQGFNESQIPSQLQRKQAPLNTSQSTLICLPTSTVKTRQRSPTKKNSRSPGSPERHRRAASKENSLQVESFNSQSIQQLLKKEQPQPVV